MSDDPNPNPDENPDEQPPEDDPAGGQPLGKDGQPFDAERAQKTIETLRAEERKARKLEKELEKAQAKLKEIEDADKSELERAKERAGELETKLAAEAERRKTINTRLAALALSADLGISDPDLALAAVTEIEYDDDGEPTNLRDRLEAACEKHPALKVPQKRQKPDTDGGAGAGDKPEPKLTQPQKEMAAKLGMSEDDYAQMIDVKNVEDWERARSAA